MYGRKFTTDDLATLADTPYKAVQLALDSEGYVELDDLFFNTSFFDPETYILSDVQEKELARYG